MRRAREPNRSAFVLLLSAAGLIAAWPLAAQTEGLCESDARYRALDFLIGEWRLVSGDDAAAGEPGGAVVGRSRVEKLEGGCLVAETWAFESGESGRTYSSYDASAGLWRRFSVSSRGVVVRSSGRIEGGALLLRGERVAADGPPVAWRERLAPVADGRVRRVAGYSTQDEVSDGSTTVEFEGYYDPIGRAVPESSAPPAPAAVDTADVERQSDSEDPAEPAATPREPVPARCEPAPASREPVPVPREPGPAPAAGEVTPDSGRATDAGNIERIAMASPMVLRLPMGTVEALPSGYAWVTRDTAPYLCEGVTIKRLEVGRLRRRGRIELKVELAVHGRQVSRAVDVSVDLRRSGQSSPEAVVASGTASSRVGRSIPEQVQYGSVAVVVTLSMDAEVFDSVVADPERPDLVITLAVGK